MSSRLNKSEFLPYAPNSSDDHQVRINHDDCPAGVDTRQRLYIKRLKDGTVVAFCHNCGESGVSKSKIRNIYSYIKSSLSYAISSKDLRMPVDGLSDPLQWPTQAQAWLYKYGLTRTEIIARGITYSPQYGRIVFPLYMGGNYIGWQGRSLDQTLNPPKYINRLDKGRTVGNCGEVAAYPPASDHVVLCEDMVSSVKVSRQINAICTLGTNPTDEVINWITKNYDYVLIWFDNDKPDVREKQIYYYRFLQALLPGRVELITSIKGDPKNHTDDEIKSILRL